MAEGEAGWVHHEKVRPPALFHFSETKSVHSVLVEPISQSAMPGTVVGVSRYLKVQASATPVFSKEQTDKQVTNEGEKPPAAGLPGGSKRCPC